MQTMYFQVLEKYKQTPMSHKAILKSIQEDNLKDIGYGISKNSYLVHFVKVSLN